MSIEGYSPTLWTNHLPQALDWHIVLLRLTFAAAFAAAIGWDREAARRPAGLRTNMLVGLGSAILAIIAEESTAVDSFSSEHISLDPARILGAVVGGIGFLGAGAVIQSKGDVKGLTTAAGIWVSAAIGLSTGLGMLFLAAVSTVLAFLILRSLRSFEVHIKESTNGEPQDESD